VTPEDKANARQVLLRLKDANVIEAYGKKADVYRRINPELLIMDYKNANPTPLDLWLPFGLHNMVYAYAKNIYVFGGEKDAGKTAVLLDIVKYNMDKWKVHYFSSELSPEELSVRLRKYVDTDIKDWNFTAYERSSDFADIVQPNDLNIIDWLEINEDFPRIGLDIQHIHEKLDKGIAIIAVGKDASSMYGRGKDFSRQRARLYVTMSNIGKSCIAKILTAKCKKGAIDPVGMTMRYQIFDGHDVKILQDWHHEVDDDDYRDNDKLFKD
jgi:hypothetical protein